MHNPFKAGEEVAWDTPKGPTRGRVVRKLTSPMGIKGHHLTASKDNPQYLRYARHTD